MQLSIRINLLVAKSGFIWYNWSKCQLFDGNRMEVIITKGFKKLGCMLLSLCLLIPCWQTSALAAVKVVEPDSEMQDTYDYQIEGGIETMERLRQAGMAAETWAAGYRVQFQTAAEYQSIKYGRGTIYSSACGPASLCNAMYAAGMADVDIPTMCNLAVSCGARVSGGTNETTLLNAAAPIYGFTFTETSSSQKLKEHLEAGGVAIAHAGTKYPLFTTGGHYLAAVGIEGDTVTLLDSYWYDDKYTSTKIRRNNVTIEGMGVIKTSLSQAAKACADRSPSYYLLYEVPAVLSAAEKGDAPFTDILENTWYYNSVVNTYQNKLMSGTGDNTFEPESILTRAMVAQIMYANAGMPIVDSSEAAGVDDNAVDRQIQFNDVVEDDWFSDAVTWAAKEGIVAGYGEGIFAPNDNITREQLAMILYRTANSPDVSGALSDLSYPDCSRCSDWAQVPLLWAIQNGIITGSDDNGVITLNPQGFATRAQAAAMIMQFIKLL